MMEAHPFAGIFPLLEGSEFDGLVADIKANGLAESIVTHDGQILDGRNRCRALEALGYGDQIEKFCEDYGGPNPLAFVISKNLKRRHLDESQRAWAASKVATLPKGRPETNASIEAFTQDEAAEMLNVSRSAVQRATIVRGAETEIQHAVEQGKLAVSLAAQATKLPPEQQRDVAKRAEAGEVNVVRKVVKQAVRADKEKKLGAKQKALPDKRYGVILADPEWRFETWSADGLVNSSPDNHYSTSALAVIKDRDVASISADHCVLFLWSTVPMLPQALEVMAAWGFKYVTNFAWGKDKAGTGYWNRNRHETLLVGTKGKPPAPAPGTQWDSLINAKVGEHSAKPEKFLRLIETYFPTLPKIELNRRGKARKGWDAWGAEAEP